MKRLLALCCLVFLLAATSLAQAHGGRTDAYGCHMDRKTGIRH